MARDSQRTDLTLARVWYVDNDFPCFEAMYITASGLATSTGRDMSPRPLALVAGVGDGLGKAVARRFARAGHLVVLVARKEEKLRRIAAEIAETYYALHCQDRSAWTLEIDVRPWSEKF